MKITTDKWMLLPLGSGTGPPNRAKGTWTAEEEVGEIQPFSEAPKGHRVRASPCCGERIA